MNESVSRSSRILVVVAVAAAAFFSLWLLGGLPPLGPSLAEAQYEPPPPPPKVTLCHHVQGKRATAHVTIRVSQSAVRAHLRHGDTRGRCGTAANQRAHSKKAHALKWHKQAKLKAKAKKKRK